MRYAKIEEYEVSNGHLGGQSLYVQGCRFRCPNCFNPETWDFNGGKEWTPEVEDKFIELASRPYIKRISLLGGECLADENLDGVLNLVNKIRLLLPDKTIWLYTGYDFNNLMHWTEEQYEIDVHNNFRLIKSECLRQAIICQCDVVVDGRYIDSQRNISLKWRGSANQNVVDVKKSLRQGKKVLYCD
jgi:anaerobic ribonucleoside-triphosphate reductase activating protein